jgi:phage-related holin
MFNLIQGYTTHFVSNWLATIGATMGVVIIFLFGSLLMFYIFIVLFILDAITGVCASLIKNETINSKRWKESVYKLLAYLSVILVTACLGLVFPTLTWLIGAALGWILLSEGISILENCETILGKKIPFLKKIKTVLDTLKSNNINIK